MLKTPRQIHIVRSTAKGLSSLSAPSAQAILAVLSTEYTDVRITIVNTYADLQNVALQNPELVFLGMKYVPLHTVHDSKKVWLAEYLQSKGIPTTGSSSDAHKLELDKSLAKAQASESGLKTSPFYVVRQNGTIEGASNMLHFPMFVKPSDRGGGLGIDGYSVVSNIEQLDKKVSWLSTKYGADSLVEQYLPGREFSVAVLASKDSDTYSVFPLELIAPENVQGTRLLSAEVKSADAERVKLIDDPALESRVSELAFDIFTALGARDYGRIDIRLDENGEPNFLEANLIPSLISNYGSFPKACMLHEKLSHRQMILQIAELAISRDNQRISQKIYSI